MILRPLFLGEVPFLVGGLPFFAGVFLAPLRGPLLVFGGGGAFFGLGGGGGGAFFGLGGGGGGAFFGLGGGGGGAFLPPGGGGGGGGGGGRFAVANASCKHRVPLKKSG